jgi:hypothetical protein
MNHFFKVGIMMLACFGMNLAAQDWYHDREMRFHGEEWRGHIFEHVRTDMDHIGSAVFASPKEQNRLQRTKFQLGELQDKLNHGIFDDRELQAVINQVGTASGDQRLSPRDRDILHDDLNKLRDYRAHHDHWMH